MVQTTLELDSPNPHLLLLCGKGWSVHFFKISPIVFHRRKKDGTLDS